MKTLSIFLAGFLLLIAFPFIPPKHNIVGRWFTYTSDGSKFYIDLKSDGTFQNYYKEKLVHYGNYTFKDPVVLINDKEDDSCGSGYWGKYNVTFFGKDSLSFVAIEDSCAGRKEGVNGMA